MRAWGLSLIALVLAMIGCGGAGRCERSSDCKTGVCLNGRCEPVPLDASDEDAAALDALDADASDGPVDPPDTLDTLDADADCVAGEPRSCYTGPDGTAGVGLCAEGTEECVDGGWTACGGEVKPSAFETLGDGLDDDCDGTADEIDSSDPVAAWNGTHYGLVYSDTHARGRDTYFVLVSDSGTLASEPLKLNAELSDVEGPSYNAIASSDSQFGVSWLRAASPSSELHFVRVQPDGVTASVDESVATSECGAPEMIWAESVFAMVFAPENWAEPKFLTVTAAGSVETYALEGFRPAHCEHISLTFVASSGFGVAWAARQTSPIEFSVEFAGFDFGGGEQLAPRELFSIEGGGVPPEAGAYSEVRLAWTGDRWVVLVGTGGETQALLLDDGGVASEPQVIDETEYEISPLLLAQSEVGAAFSASTLQIGFVDPLVLDFTTSPIATDSPPLNASVAEAETGVAFFYETRSDTSSEIWMGTATQDSVTLPPVQVSPN